MNQVTPTALVVALSRREVDVEALKTASARLADAEFRAAFVDRAARLRVLGLVLIRLARTAVFETLPTDASEEFRALLTQVRRATARLDLERDRLISVMRRAAVEPVLLKGSGLRRSLYTEPAERHIADIDLLVSEQELDAALSVACGAGYVSPPDHVTEAYRRHHFHLRLTHPVGYDVEIHWGLSEPHCRFRLDAVRLERESVVFPRRDGPPLRMPRPEDMLLHLTLQNVQERFLWFNRLVDIDRILATNSLDLNLLVQRAREAGLETALALTLTLSHRMLAAEFPAEVLDRVEPSSIVRAHLKLLSPEDWMLSPESPRPTVANRLMDLWLLPGLRSRTAALLWLLTEPGFSDPLHRALGTAAPSGLATRLLSMVKLATYQLRSYLDACRAHIVSRGRRPLGLGSYDA